MNCSASETELLAFWAAGTLSGEEAARVESHLAGCPLCRSSLSEIQRQIRGLRALHLTSDEAVAAAWDEGSFEHLKICVRCRDEVVTLRAMNRELLSPASSSLRWRQLALAAGLAFVTLATVTLVRAPGRTVPSDDGARVAPTPSITTPWQRHIKVEKASLASLANETLVMRGAPRSRPALLKDLAVALEPYRRDDFEEAAAHLRALRPRYPDASEVPYYLGICLLLLDRPAEALAPLEAVVSQGKDAGEARFYLAVARVNAARTRDESKAGLDELASLCNGPTNVASRACAAWAAASKGS